MQLSAVTNASLIDWQWTGKDACFTPASLSLTLYQKQFVLRVPGYHVQLLPIHLVNSCTSSALLQTWQFSGTDLANALEDA